MSMQGNGFAAEVHKRGIQTGIPEGWSPAEDLLEVPGVKRSDYEEKFYAREYPLKSWLLKRMLTMWLTQPEAQRLVKTG